MVLFSLFVSRIHSGQNWCTHKNARLEIAPTRRGSESPTERPHDWRESQRPRDRMERAGPQLAHCFPVTDQGQSGSVWTHRLWDVSRQLHMTLSLRRQCRKTATIYPLHTPPAPGATQSPPQTVQAGLTGEMDMKCPLCFLLMINVSVLKVPAGRSTVLVLSCAGDKSTAGPFTSTCSSSMLKNFTFTG